MKYYKFQKSPTHFCFTTSKECSGQISQKSAENLVTLLIHLFAEMMHGHFRGHFCNFVLWNLKKLVIHIFSEIYIY